MDVDSLTQAINSVIKGSGPKGKGRGKGKGKDKGNAKGQSAGKDGACFNCDKLGQRQTAGVRRKILAKAQTKAHKAQAKGQAKAERRKVRVSPRVPTHWTKQMKKRHRPSSNSHGRGDEHDGAPYGRPDGVPGNAGEEEEVEMSVPAIVREPEYGGRARGNRPRAV